MHLFQPGSKWIARFYFPFSQLHPRLDPARIERVEDFADGHLALNALVKLTLRLLLVDSLATASSAMS